MIKKLFGVITGVLALNFLAVAGGVGYLVATHKLDREKVQSIRQLILVGPATEPTSQPATQPTTQQSADDAPMLRLDALLAKYRERPAPEQIELVRGELDSQATNVERRSREVADQRSQITMAIEDLRKQREAFEAEKKAFEATKLADAQQATDAGFQKSLELYGTLPPKKVKSIFLTLDDDTVVRYLQAMDPRQAGGVLKEFKTPAEITRAQQLLEKVRRAQAKAE